MGSHFYRPSEGHGLAHDPFNAIVAPRPIGWIGTLTADGRRNLAPYSVFSARNSARSSTCAPRPVGPRGRG